MKLSLFLLLNISAGCASELEKQEDRQLFLTGFISNLFYPPTKKPTARPSLRPTPIPVYPATAKPAPTSAPTLPKRSIADHLKLVDTKIRATITADQDIAATYLRLGFHDCVPNGVAGGCDGCINLANEANKGLKKATDALAPIVAEFEDKIIGVSRADIWAYSALVGSEMSQSQLVFTDNFAVGRKNCETVATCSSKDPVFCATNGPDQLADFPDSDISTHELVAFMNDHFGFNADETVAIMGAHSIGKALPENSGYQGQEGWDNDHKKLDNDYYKAIVGAPVREEGPDWFPIQVLSSGEWQWVPAGGDPEIGTGGFPSYLFGKGGTTSKFAVLPYIFNPLITGWQWSGVGDVPPFMLNADIAIVRDLGNGKLDQNGKPLCSFRFPQFKKCPLASTLNKAGEYRDNNDLWLADFKIVLLKMLKKGMP